MKERKKEIKNNLTFSKMLSYFCSASYLTLPIVLSSLKIDDKLHPY